MSTNYYTCDGCRCGFANDNHGLAKWCNDCGHRFHDLECADFREKTLIKDGDDEDGWYYDYSNCCVCRKEVVTDYELFKFALKQLGLTKEQLTVLYKKEY